MGRTKNTYTSAEGYMIANGVSGDTFYTEKPANCITAMASVAKRQVSTEQVIAIGQRAQPKATYEAKTITKVTLLNFKTESNHEQSNFSTGTV